jgi:hypothetical protein
MLLEPKHTFSTNASRDGGGECQRVTGKQDVQYALRTQPSKGKQGKRESNEYEKDTSCIRRKSAQLRNTKWSGTWFSFS